MFTKSASWWWRRRGLSPERLFLALAAATISLLTQFEGVLFSSMFWGKFAKDWCSFFSLCWGELANETVWSWTGLGWEGFGDQFGVLGRCSARTLCSFLIRSR